MEVKNRTELGRRAKLGNRGMRENNRTGRKREKPEKDIKGEGEGEPSEIGERGRTEGRRAETEEKDIKGEGKNQARATEPGEREKPREREQNRRWTSKEEKENQAR